MLLDAVWCLKSLYFAFTFERYFHWVQNSSLTVLICQYLKDVVQLYFARTVSGEKAAVLLIPAPPNAACLSPPPRKPPAQPLFRPSLYHWL